MNKKILWGALAAASLSLAACSSDELAEDQPVQEVPEVSVENGFKELGEFEILAKLGNGAGAQFDSRTSGDVNFEGRPLNVYPLDKIGLLGLHSTVQPNAGDINQVIDYGYDHKIDVKWHDLSGLCRLYYKLIDVDDNKDKGASDGGKIAISTDRNGTNQVVLDLSIFALEDLARLDGDDVPETEHIKLNQFAYGRGIKGNLRGTALRYVSYDPKNDLLLDVERQALPKSSGRYAELPAYAGPDADLMTDEFNPTLVQETTDKYFTSPEILIAAANDKIYILTSKLNTSRTGGYYVKQTYPSPDGTTRHSSVEMNRLTTVVNTSFMIVDKRKEGRNSYFNENSETATIKNFYNKFGVDLSTLECPYATFDGFNARYYMNDNPEIDRSEEPTRMVMWAPGMTITAANGVEYEKYGKRSMNLNYNLDGNLQRGYGIQGESYSVAFPGSEVDNKDKEINFWVEVDGAHVVISAEIAEGIAFSPNTGHNVMVFVPAKPFADFVKDHRYVVNSRSSADYPVFKVSSENVVVTE